MRQPTPQFDGHRPHRRIAVDRRIDRGEAAVYGAQTPQPRVAEPLQRTDPQFEVGAHRILHQHGQIAPPQRIGDLLHGKGIRRRARPDPQQVDSGIERRGDVFGRSRLRGDVHARLAPHAPQPRQTLGADPSKPPGLVRGFHSPARKIRTPSAARQRAVASVCSSVSALQGPATTSGRRGSTPAKRRGCSPSIASQKVSPSTVPRLFADAPTAAPAAEAHGQN